MSDEPRTAPEGAAKSGGLLGIIETVGNKLPDPAILFVIGMIVVMSASWVASVTNWQVQPKKLIVVTETVVEDGQEVTRPILKENGSPETTLVDDPSVNEGEPFESVSLFSADGIYWCLSSMVDNFINFPPLGVVLVGMIGIGVAERTGFIGVVLKAAMLVVPNRLLTPAMVFLGIMSSLGTDAGYVVLPPVAAVLYKSVGRAPLAGVAAVFAGVAAGFNANLLITSLDPLLSELTQAGARTIDPNYDVPPTANWRFLFVSTFAITGAGWLASALFVEKRLSKKPEDEGGPSPDAAAAAAEHQGITSKEAKGLVAAVLGIIVMTGIFLSFAFVPNWPFDDARGRLPGDNFDRWVEAIVPMLCILFLIPGLIYGVVAGTMKNSSDAARMMTETMASMAPIVVLAFFAGQFIEYFKYSNLDKMLAHTGGQALASADLSPMVLIVAFILLTAFFNLFVGSMSAKYSMFAPIFVPMLMLVGISPALTQVAYRIGDSVTNIITPLNAYLIIVLVVMQRFAPRAGMGTLIAMMAPYTIVFLIVWTIMLLVWMWFGWPLSWDDSGPLTYIPQAAS
ncbi:MAG: AbgT family transporter [Planctomycetota bacterium]